MSEVRLVIREANCDWSGTIHGSCADSDHRAQCRPCHDRRTGGRRRAVRQADRESWLLRKPPERIQHRTLRRGPVVIDLVARLVVVDSTYCSPARKGTVNYHDGRSAPTTYCGTTRPAIGFSKVMARGGSIWPKSGVEILPPCRVPMPDKFSMDGRSWSSSYGKSSPRSPGGTEPQPEPAHSEKYVRDTLKQIHANWLLTPPQTISSALPARGRDLSGTTTSIRISRIDANNGHAWANALAALPRRPMLSSTGASAPTSWSSTTNSFAICSGLAGIRLHRDGTITGGRHRSLLLTVGDFLTTEVPRLESVREAWLDTPDPEFHGRTPRSIIARERARLPEAVFGKDAVIDPDCSCCQMMAELPGPTFWHLDGCNMDDEFAFNIHCKTPRGFGKKSRATGKISTVASKREARERQRR